MVTIIGAAAGDGGSLYSNPLVQIGLVLVTTYIFLKFCSFAKKQQLAKGAKKIVYIITGLGLVGLNVLYGQGNAAVIATGDWTLASIALLSSFALVFIFAFALMAETKTE